MKKKIICYHSLILAIIIFTFLNNCNNGYIYPINKIKKAIEQGDNKNIEKFIKKYFTFHKEIEYKNIKIQYFQINKINNIEQYDLIKIIYNTNTYYKSESYIETNITYSNNNYFGFEWSTLGNCSECEGLYIFCLNNTLIDLGTFYHVIGPNGYYFDTINSEILKRQQEN